jgi:hypothetical protein
MEPSQEESSDANFRDIFSGLTEQELREAERNFQRYLEIALQICAEQSSNSAPEVDTPEMSSTMKERSNKSLKN